MTQSLGFVCTSVTVERGWGPDAHDPGGEIERTIYTYRFETTSDDDGSPTDRQLSGTYRSGELLLRSTAANAFHIGGRYELGLTSSEPVLRLAA